MMIPRRIVFSSLAAALLAIVPGARAQSAADAGNTSQPAQSVQPDSKQVSSTATHAEPAVSYRRPTERERIRNYAFDAFGPYPILAAATTASIQQAYGTPPEWRQGWGAFGKRVASNYGIQFITTSTRYVVAEAFREDTLYYRCACSGFLPRFGHALLSTVMARHGADGRYMFSVAALGAPYAGTMSAALGWYPSRYEPMDGFRMGNYNLAGTAGQNIALEFIYGGPHTLLGKVRILRGRSTGADQTP